MKSFIFKNYEQSFYNQWNHYYDKSINFLLKNEEVTNFIAKNLKKEIQNIVIFGCANGRDFLPFDENYNCIGFDIAPPEKINFICSEKNLSYYQCSLQDFISSKENEFNNIDWNKSLVYTQGTLMYINHYEQNLFINKIIDLGCKNIVLQEYDEESEYDPYLKLNEKNSKIFVKKLFRSERKGQPIAHILME